MCRHTTGCLFGSQSTAEGQGIRLCPCSALHREFKSTACILSPTGMKEPGCGSSYKGARCGKRKQKALFTLWPFSHSSCLANNLMGCCGSAKYDTINKLRAGEMSHFQFPFGRNLKGKGESDTAQEALLPCSTELLLFAVTQGGGERRKKKRKKSAEQL